MISLLMLSGGIDSAYALAKLLRETDDEVLVHHIHLLTNFGRHGPEGEACRQIVAYCQREFRPFAYTQSAIDHRRFAAHGYDLIAAGFEVGMIAASYKLVTKRTIDRWIVGIAGDDGVPPERLENAQRCCEFNAQRVKPPQLFIFPRVSLLEQVEYMPKALFDMTWSCRRPVHGAGPSQPCGVCPACLRRNTMVMRGVDGAPSLSATFSGSYAPAAPVPVGVS